MLNHTKTVTLQSEILNTNLEKTEAPDLLFSNLGGGPSQSVKQENTI